MRDKHVKDEIFNLFFKTGFLINITVKLYQYKNSRPGGIFYGRYQSGCTLVEGIEPVLSIKANIYEEKIKLVSK